MESFALAADHSGAINHLHTVTISPAIVGLARELRLAVTVVVAGWVVAMAPWHGMAQLRGRARRGQAGLRDV
ncbi:hypothetical protein DHEL01_v203479 [Diaporthe helianthi]|uniref:Uncharacterized protein n=1 Tax=Diaporthe helianthi TaxID=158607 RepID=A0A2P5I6J4_DIAHE|nr:hypothetical protein DHEL01_v203479 [Diaporthe helianthi]